MSGGILFNGSVSASSGVTVSHSRAWATVDAAGTTVPANTPLYGPGGIVVAPPLTTIVADSTAYASANKVYGSGSTWSDGTPALIREYSTGATASFYIDIYVNVTISAGCFNNHPSRSIDARWLAADATYNPLNRKNQRVDISKGNHSTGAVGEDADWSYTPVAYLLEGGCPLALCYAEHWNGSAFQTDAIALFWWDDTLSSGNKWTLIKRTPSVQTNHARGNVWAMTQAYQFTDDPLTRWVPVVDYRGNSGSTGGELWLLKLSRTSTSSRFTPGSLVPIFTVDNSLTGTHFHGCSMWKYGNGLGLLVDLGDTLMARTVAITRNDTDYTFGYTDPGPTPVSETFVAPDLAPDNAATTSGDGWTNWMDVSGDPDTSGGGIAFTAGAWTDATKALVHANFNSATAGVGSLVGCQIVLTGGTGVTNPTVAVITGHSSTTLTLDRDINGASGNVADVAGYVARGLFGSQPVAKMHRYGSNRLFFGVDEGGPSVTSAVPPSFTDTDIKLRYDTVPSLNMSSAWGVMDGAGGVGTPATAAIRSFVGVDGGAEAQGPFCVDARPGNEAGWITKTDFSRLLYAPQGLDYFASMYKPNTADANTVERFVWYNSPDGNRYLLYGPRTSTNDLVAIPEPVSSYVRPLVSGQLAVSNLLLASTVDPAIAGTTGNSTYTVKTAAEITTLVSGQTIPPPPCQGEIALVDGKDAYYWLRKIAAVDSTKRIRVKFWVYPLPPSIPAASPGSAPYAASRLYFGLYAGDANDWFGHKRMLNAGNYPFSGSGWHPVTMDFDAPSTWTSGGSTVWAGTRDLAFGARYQNGQFNRPSSFLIAWDSVVQDTTDIPAMSPAPASTTAAAVTTITIPAQGASWSILGRMRCPHDGADEMTLNRGSYKICTFTDGTATWVLSYGSATFSLTDGTTTISVTASSGAFFRNRGDWIHLAISNDGAAPLTTLYVSMGASALESANSAAMTLPSSGFTSIKSGASDGSAVDAMEWLDWRWTPSALSSSQVTASLAMANLGLSISSRTMRTRTNASRRGLGPR